jgi:RNA polymerase sigma-70 factor (ECF subfamily)
MQPSDVKPTGHLWLVAKSGSPQPTDEALVSAYLSGEPRAAEQIWQKHAPMVDRLLRRSLGPRQDVEDLTQEVFLRLFAKLHTLEDPEALRSFVYSIAVRVLRWDLRRRWIRRTVRLLPSGSLPERSTPSDNFEARQAVSRFYDILDRLGDRDRIAFILQNMEGLTLQESARTLGISVATFKRRLSRASQRIEFFVAKDTALAGYLEHEKGEGHGPA